MKLTVIEMSDERYERRKNPCILFCCVEFCEMNRQHTEYLLYRKNPQLEFVFFLPPQVSSYSVYLHSDAHVVLSSVFLYFRTHAKYRRRFEEKQFTERHTYVRSVTTLIHHLFKSLHIFYSLCYRCKECYSFSGIHINGRHKKCAYV